MKGIKSRIKAIAVAAVALVCLGAGFVYVGSFGGVFADNQTRGLYVSASKAGESLPVDVFAVRASDHPDAFAVKMYDKDAPVEVRLTLDPQAEKFVISATGLEAFSDVTFETFKEGRLDGSAKTKTDWAGLFREREALAFNPAFLKGEQTYKVAFYGQIQDDAALENPYLIEVYSAPGGGLGDGTLVNEFTALACGTYSWCDEGRVAAQNQALVDNYVRAFMLMTAQLSAGMMQQVGVIGSFFDAKMALQTQTHLRKLQAEAHRDYHPDEQMCRFGTFVRSVAQSEAQAEADKKALNTALTKTYVNIFGGGTAEGTATDIASRLEQFRTVYCDPTDNNGGLQFMCDWEQDENPSKGSVGAADADRMNRDINYTRTVGAPLALDVNFTDNAPSADEEDVIALARNLFWHEPLKRITPKAARNRFADYMDARRGVAIMNVAHNSFSEIVSQKAAADLEDGSGPSYMKALIKELGVEDDADINALLGARMSYYGQMEVLTKKIYQSPEFYTNLYTKPANLSRISASVDAISSIQERDQLEASLREEMLLSMLLEQALMSKTKRLDGLLRTQSSGAKNKSGR